VRREIYEKYGEKGLYEGGLSVRTTLDPKMQVIAHKALADGLVHYDEAQGFRRRHPEDRRQRRLGREACGRARPSMMSRPGASRSCWRPRTVGPHRLPARA